MNKLLLGDCLDKLNELDDNSVDSIVTDPPYGLSFMGKKWDYDVPSKQIWEECMRVLKPGGHLLAFAGSRTYHRMAIRIEEAGFEIRDQIMWVYGSGFPKSHNIGKGVDKKLGNEREMVRVVKRTGKNDDIYGAYRGNNTETKGNSEWEGWGTALKPAHEPIVMARKPFSGTVVDNVLEWGTGGINIDESRISTDENITTTARNTKSEHFKQIQAHGTYQTEGQKLGRFPANIIFDEEAGKILDGQNGGGASRFFYCPKTSKNDRNEGFEHLPNVEKHGHYAQDEWSRKNIGNTPDEKRAPIKNNHPTVKPTDLMLYLIRLVTPKGGVTLDPFMGSGSTGKGAVKGGFNFIGIEREEEYYKIAEARIEHEQSKFVQTKIDFE